MFENPQSKQTNKKHNNEEKPEPVTFADSIIIVLRVVMGNSTINTNADM